MIFGKLRKHIGAVLHDLANQKESVIVEGHLMLDHIHMCISIPPKYSVSQAVGLDEEMVRAYIRDQEKEDLIRKILQLAEANVPGEVRWWLQRRVDVEEASQDGSAG